MANRAEGMKNAYLNLPLVLEPPDGISGDQADYGDEGSAIKEEEFVAQELTRFGYFVGAAAAEEPVRIPIVLVNLPRRIIGSVEAGKEVKWECPIALPFLEAMYSVTAGAFHAYQRAVQETGRDSVRPIICRQVCLALGRVLLLVENIKSGKEKLGQPVWEGIPGGFRVLSASKYHPDGVAKARYVPGRNSLAIAFRDRNPLVANHNSTPTEAEFRLDIDGCGTDVFELTMDTSVRIWSEQNFKGGAMAWHSPKVGIEQLDFVFGKDRHHFPIGRGSYQECYNYEAAFMCWLGLGNMIKSTSDLPPRVKKT